MKIAKMIPKIENSQTQAMYKIGAGTKMQKAT